MAQNVLHVRYAFKGFDLPLERLGLKTSASEERIKQALARHLTVPREWLEPFTLQHDHSGDLTLRSEAY